MNEEELKKTIERGIEGAAATVQTKGRVVVALPEAATASALILLKAHSFEHLSAISCRN